MRPRKFWCCVFTIWIPSSATDTGNKFAEAGNFKKAVQYYTDAIKCNPTEYK